MLNYEKVRKYLKNKIAEYVEYYPSEQLEETKIEVRGGSFGACLITLIHKDYNACEKYISRYSDIDAYVSNFVCRLYDRHAEKVYDNYKKEIKKEKSFKLDIFANDKLVNTIESADPLTVAQELSKIVIAEKVRQVKTRWAHIPYSKDLKVTQYFPNVTEKTSYKYVYYFKNIEE